MTGRVEPIDRLLVAGIVFFTLLLIVVSKWSPNDGQTFQVISGLLTGFGGAFFARLKPPEKQVPPGTTVLADTTTVVHTPEEIK